MSEKRNDTREQLADYAHQAWSGWMRHLFAFSGINSDGSCTIPPGLVARWLRLMKTAYADLTEEEKASDRKEADRMLKILADDEFDMDPEFE